MDGKDGRDGRDGEKGKRGERGEKGKDGRDGRDGKDCDCDCQCATLTETLEENDLIVIQRDSSIDINNFANFTYNQTPGSSYVVPIPFSTSTEEVTLGVIRCSGNAFIQLIETFTCEVEIKFDFTVSKGCGCFKVYVLLDSQYTILANEHTKCEEGNYSVTVCPGNHILVIGVEGDNVRTPVTLHIFNLSIKGSCCSLLGVTQQTLESFRGNYSVTGLYGDILTFVEKVQNGNVSLQTVPSPTTFVILRDGKYFLSWIFYSDSPIPIILEVFGSSPSTTTIYASAVTSTSGPQYMFPGSILFNLKIHDEINFHFQSSVSGAPIIGNLSIL